jgi:proteic killer suppression protein
MAARPVFSQSMLNGCAMLGRLHASSGPQDMNLPGLGLHELSGERKGDWAVKVSGSWRVTFRFVGKDAEAVDYEEYH